MKSLRTFELTLIGVICFPLLAWAQPPVSDRVTKAIAYVRSQPSDHPYAAVLDFAAHSATRRFHVVRRSTGEIVQSFVVAHGSGSEGKLDDGFAETFSNVNGSKASSLGLYRTASTYASKEPGHGLSLYLDGLSSTNSNAMRRSIVVHANWYMEPVEWKRRKMARPGRSFGCMVFSAADRDVVVRTLKSGALIYAFFDQEP